MLSASALADETKRCAALAGLTMSAADIGLPTNGAHVSTAVIRRDGQDSDFCQVNGAIAPVNYTSPDINFQVNLPLDWNRKTLHFGGGGFNGKVVEATGHYTKQPTSEATPLQRGYVTYGSDSGHQSDINFDGSFLIDPEALRNFGHEQLKKTHDVAIRLVKAFYKRRPERNYFIGGSQGGHEGFDVAQRYPDDYDGVVAAYPAHNLVMLHLSALRYARALRANDGAGWLSPVEATFLSAEVYARCDGLDGIEDGVISNVSACQAATAELKLLDDTNPIRCNNASDKEEGCLSEDQLRSLNLMDTPYELGFSLFRDDGGNATFPKWTPFEGSTFFDGGFPNLGAEGPEQALQAMPGDATPRFAIAGDLTLDTFVDFDPRQYAARIRELTPIYSANSTDLDRFRARGGKLIFYHGAVDDFIPVYSSIQYYLRLQARYADGLADFARFYVIPGMGHITGPFSARIPTLEALERWVEQGDSPGTLTAVDAHPDHNGRTRPVCEYPGWPQYKGHGDAALASSFNCSPIISD